MSYQIEEVDTCTKKIVFNYETLDLSNEVASAVKKKQKTVSLKGFRQGKAPLSVVENMYKGQIELDVLNNFVQKEVFQAISEEKLQVVGQPAMEDMKYDPGKSISFKAVVEIFPEVEVKDLSGLSFEKDKVQLDDEEFDKTIAQYLESKAEMVEIKDDITLDKGHFAVLNFEGEKEDGERPDNMKGSEFLLEIGSNQFIPGFEDGMIGMKKTEKKTIEVVFPKEYQAPELADKPVKFDVELLEIKEKKFPELNDEIAKEMNFDSAEDLKEKTRKNLLNQKENASKEKLNKEILEKLCEENSFDIPKAMIASQENHLKKDLEQTLTSQGFNDKMMSEYFEKWSGDMSTKAEFQVKSGLILESLATKMKIEVNDDEFEKKIAQIAADANLEVDQVKSYYGGDANMKKNMMYSIREEKTFEKIYEQVSITEK